MRTEHSILACLSLLAVGCNGGQSNTVPAAVQSKAPEAQVSAANAHSSIDAVNPSTATETTNIEGALSRYGWYETTGDDASHFLIAQLTIPGFSHDWTRKFAIQRLDRSDGEGLLSPDKSSPWMNSYSDGHNAKGGFGVGGGMHLVDDQSDNNSIMLDVGYSWTTPDQVQGNLNRRVPVKIDMPVDVSRTAVVFASVGVQNLDAAKRFVQSAA
jgi:hypothetical protein